MLPSIKIFLWKLAHGGLSTGDNLYQLNIGPNLSCPLCGLVDKTTDHLFWNCNKILHYWYDAFARIGWNQNDIPFLSSGYGLLNSVHSKDLDLRAKTLIVAVASIIWKNRCNLIFQGCPINHNKIVARAWSLYLDYKNVYIREFHKQKIFEIIPLQFSQILLGFISLCLPVLDSS